MLNREILLKALRWLAQNPDKHIAGDLARKRADEIQTVSTLDPEATCFCALGRYAKEAEIDVEFLDWDAFGSTRRELAKVWQSNDRAYGTTGAIEDKRRALSAVGDRFDITDEEIFS